MAKRAGKAKGRVAEDRYFGLVRAFPLRPLRSEAELDGAIAVIDSLLDRDDLDAGEKDYLDVLGDLVEKYEAEHHPIAPASDADLLRFFIESNDLSQAELASATGIAESTISEILSGRRKLRRQHIDI